MSDYALRRSRLLEVGLLLVMLAGALALYFSIAPALPQGKRPAAATEWATAVASFDQIATADNGLRQAAPALAKAESAAFLGQIDKIEELRTAAAAGLAARRNQFDGSDKMLAGKYAQEILGHSAELKTLAGKIRNRTQADRVNRSVASLVAAGKRLLALTGTKP